TRWFEDVAYTSINGVCPLRRAAIGGFANILLTDETQITTNAQPSGTGKTFREMDGIFGISGGINLNNHISAGATGKICSQKIGDESAVGFAGNLGFLCKAKHVALGLAFQNIGTKMKFLDKGFALPATIRTGLAWTSQYLTISGEMANILSEKKTIAYVGLEGWLSDVIALRGGYDSENGHGITAGFGVRIKNVQLDYACIPYEKFEAAHRLSVSVRFGSRTDSEKIQKTTDSSISRIMIEPDKTTPITSHQIDRDKEAVSPAPCPYNTTQQQSAQTPAQSPALTPTHPVVSAPPVTTTSSSTTVALPKSSAPIVQKQTAKTPASSTTPASLRTGTSTVPILPPIAGQPPKQKAAPLTVKTITVIVNNAPIFSGPGTMNSIITTVPAGTELILVDDSKKWYYQVKLPDGKLGWVSYVNCKQ
ncbi:MAG: SH3 domain-containing protein, partial [bacterium]